MLLARSKELKSLNKLFCYFLVVFFTPVSTVAQTASEPSNVASSGQWITVFLSLILVVALIFMLGFLVRRFSPMHSSAGQLKSVASMMVGTRERIAVIQVGDEQHLIGVTSQNINHLAKLEKPIEGTTQVTSEQFKEKLAGFMKIQNRE